MAKKKSADLFDEAPGQSHGQKSAARPKKTPKKAIPLRY